MGAQVLRKGSRGPDVKKLQLLLNSSLKPVPRIAVDGVFGRAPHEAVMRFQREHRLLPDGVVGGRTWESLGQRGTALLSETVLMCRASAVVEIAALELGVHKDARPGNRHRQWWNIIRRPLYKPRQMRFHGARHS